MTICFCPLKGRANSKKFTGKWGGQGALQTFNVPNSLWCYLVY